MAEHIQLKAIRELNNYSQQYVAHKMGITQSYYSKIENGYIFPKPELLKKALIALGIKTPNPVFLSKTGVLESLELQQIEFQEMKSRLMALELKVSSYEIELNYLKRHLKLVGDIIE